MKVIFLGVGEAFDKNYPNNSSLVLSEKTNLLLDCGFTVPPQLWKFNLDKDFIDAIYISHQHADHYFGLPALLMRMWEGGRVKPITVIAPKGFKDSFKELMNLAYSSFPEKFKFNVNIIEVETTSKIKFNDLELSFIPTVHSQSRENLAIKITDGKSIMAYGGDGSPIANGNFYENLDLLILETYLYDKEIIGHSSIVSAIAFAEKNDVKCLALTHMNRDFRKNDLDKIRDKIISDKVKIIIPEPFGEYNL